jgi:hypothetical protein
MPIFTTLHVIISLIGIVSGLVLLYGLITARRMPAVTAVFLATTVLTSLTGFGFRRDHIFPGHVLGVLSLILLAVAITALYRFRLAGRWRTAYVASAVAALYFNVFVLVVQLFLKVPALHALAPSAPTGFDPPFATAQGAVLAAFVLAGVVAARKFHPAEAPAVA